MSTPDQPPRTAIDVQQGKPLSAAAPATPSSNNGTGPEPRGVATAAREYAQRGWTPLACPLREKGPRFEGWPDFRWANPADIELQPWERGNIALLLGEASAGLVDVDLDSPEALALAPEFLPATPMRSGRPSKPASHWFYVATAPLKKTSFADPDGTMLVELRSSRSATMVPPSLHPCGEGVAWEGESLEPTPVDGLDLRTAVTALATAALLARHWPARGGRHDTAMAAAGLLLRSGLDEALTTKIIRAAARVAGDEEWSDRATDVATTVEKLAAGEKITGGPTLEELLTRDGKKVVARLRRWIGAAEEPGRRAEVGGGEPDLLAGDIANATALVTAHGHDFHWGKFCGWLRWDGRRWARDSSDEIVQRAKAVARDLLPLVPDLAAEKDYAAIKRILASQSAAKLRAMIELAQSEPPIPVGAADLDADSWVLNLNSHTCLLTEDGA